MITMVMPTIRENSCQRFLKEWLPLMEREKVRLIIVEDNPQKTFKADHPLISHYCWEDIDRELGKDSWIIPRRTDCVRSYGFWKAWMNNSDTIISIDDDCYPEDNQFFSEHLKILSNPVPIWESTMPFRVRGMPYQNKGEQEVALNHGVWSNVPDLDAVTQLQMPDLRTKPAVNSQIMRTWFPMCGMNLAFKGKITPIMYFLLMGKDWEYDRYGDIWCGLFAQKIIRHLGYALCSGKPSIHHDKASNVFANIRKEASGYEINENLWRAIDSVVLTSYSPIQCYKELLDTLSMGMFFKIDFKNGYWKRLIEAQRIWLNLFKRRIDDENSIDNTSQPVVD